MRAIAATVIACVFGTAIGYFVLESGGLIFIALFGVMLLAPVLAILAGWAVLSKVRTGEAHRTARSGLIFVGLAAATLLVAATSRQMFETFYVGQAKAFLFAHKAELDAYRNQHGRYPDRLSDWSADIRLPRFLENGRTYTSYGDSFTISIMRPSSLFSEIVYDSERGDWRETD